MILIDSNTIYGIYKYVYSFLLHRYYIYKEKFHITKIPSF